MAALDVVHVAVSWTLCVATLGGLGLAGRAVLRALRCRASRR